MNWLWLTYCSNIVALEEGEISKNKEDFGSVMDV